MEHQDYNPVALLQTLTRIEMMLIPSQVLQGDTHREVLASLKSIRKTIANLQDQATYVQDGVLNEAKLLEDVESMGSEIKALLDKIKAAYESED